MKIVSFARSDISKMGACTSKTLSDNLLEEFREKISRMSIDVFLHFTLLIFLVCFMT